MTTPRQTRKAQAQAWFERTDAADTLLKAVVAQRHLPEWRDNNFINVSIDIDTYEALLRELDDGRRVCVVCDELMEPSVCVVEDGQYRHPDCELE